MTIETPPDQTPNQQQIHIRPTDPLAVSLWYTSQNIASVPESATGFLFAQGWVISGTSYDDSTSPPTVYYSLTRQSANNQLILQNLINSYTIAENDAKWANEIRYNQIIENWTALSGNSQDYFDTQVDEQNDHVAIYIDNLDTYMDEVDALIDSTQTDLLADTRIATAALDEMNEKLVDLESNVGDNTIVIERLLTDQSGYLDTFLTDFIAKLAELDANYSANLTIIEALLLEADTDLAAFTTTQAQELSDLSDAYDAHVLVLTGLLTTAETNLTDIATAIDAILVSIDGDYTEVDTEVNTLLASGDTAYGLFSSDYNLVLAKLESDYDAHSTSTGSLLDGLGATELARINETFAASLATQLQQLTDRGLSSSAVTTDITERNTRDRNEEIAALNDRLAREQLTNQHTLYGQQADMRSRTLAGKDRVHTVQQEILRYQASEITGLYQLLQSVRDRTLAGKTTTYSLRDTNTRLNIDVQSQLYNTGQALGRLLIDEAARLQQLQQVITQWETGERNVLLGQVQQIAKDHLAGLDKQHAASQDISRVAMTQQNTFLGQLQDAVKGFLAGKERFSALAMAHASTLADHRHRAIVEKMNEAAARQEGLRSTHADNMRLMAYQLDEQNKLLVGLYSFVERRDDIGPKFQELAQVVTALGDAGGGWMTP